MDKPLWFRITLIDVNGQYLATWNYDSHWPVIPPQFTYPNNDYRCPFSIEFRHNTVLQNHLRTDCDLNHAIYEATQKYVRMLQES